MTTGLRPTESTRGRLTAVPVGVSALFTVAVLFHGADHLRRGVHAAGDDVFWLGTLGIVFECAVVVLVVQRHRRAPEAALVVGLALAAGYIGVHFLPARSWFSDSFVSAHDVSPLSWFAASFEVVAAFVLAGSGALARGTPLAGRPPASSVASALRHPVAIAMLAGNAVILVIAFVR
jgi:hypothetical protein